MNDELSKEEFAAFIRDETESTYLFMWRLIKGPLILIGTVLVAGAITILIWRLSR